MTILFIILIYFNCHPIVTDGAIVTGISFLSQGGRSDYVLTGEGFTVQCHYLLEENWEEVESVKLYHQYFPFYKYEYKTNETVYWGVLRHSIDPSKSRHTSIYIENANVNMDGSYTCEVRTGISCTSHETNLIVIHDACKESDWHTRSDMIHCLEFVDFHCTGMWPKPSPSCGVYEQDSGRYITAETINIVQNGNSSYSLSLSHRYSAQDYAKRKGSFRFRCMFSVIGTSWTRTISSKLFARQDCTDPPRIPNGYYNVTARKTCLDTPTEGSVATYSCLPNYTLSHGPKLICVDGAWRQVASGQSSPEEDINLTTLEFLPVQDTQLPTCNKSTLSSLAISLITLITLIHCITT